MLDKESARLETMRSAAVNASGDSSRQASKSDSRGSGNAPPKSATPGERSTSMIFDSRRITRAL